MTAVSDLLKHLYRLDKYTVYTTEFCPYEVTSRLLNLLGLQGLTWLSELDTGTSRQLLAGTIGGLPQDPVKVVFKSSRTSCIAPNTISADITAAVSELEANAIIRSIAEAVSASEIPVSAQSFRSICMKVETPLGVVVDEACCQVYTIYVFESSYESGELLSQVEPPIQGATFYNPEDWRLFCAAGDILDVVKRKATEHGLRLRDYGVHQILYRYDKTTDELALVLLDSERIERIDADSV